MLKTLIIFMPVVACAFWILIHILEGFRIRSFGNVVTLLIFTALFLFSDSCYTDVRTNWSIIATTGLIAQFAAPCIIPIVGSYLRRLRNDPGPHPLQLLWIIAPAALLTSGLLLYFLSGDTAIQQFNADLEANGSAILKNYCVFLPYRDVQSYKHRCVFIHIGEVLPQPLQLIVGNKSLVVYNS